MRIVRADAEGRRARGRACCAPGGVVVVPTDTVYGLAARPGDADAVRAVFRAKGRPEGMHLPVLAASRGAGARARRGLHPRRRALAGGGGRDR